MGCRKSGSKREFHSNTGLQWEARKISNKQPNLTPQGARKRPTKHKTNRRQEIVKNRAKINGIETKKIQKKTVEHINETKEMVL